MRDRGATKRAGRGMMEKGGPTPRGRTPLVCVRAGAPYGTITTGQLTNPAGPRTVAAWAELRSVTMSNSALS